MELLKNEGLYVQHLWIFCYRHRVRLFLQVEKIFNCCSIYQLKHVHNNNFFNWKFTMYYIINYIAYYYFVYKKNQIIESFNKFIIEFNLIQIYKLTFFISTDYSLYH